VDFEGSGEGFSVLTIIISLVGARVWVGGGVFKQEALASLVNLSMSTLSWTGFPSKLLE
jgi:hypothetical protein